jgi:hypothetical protein
MLAPTTTTVVAIDDAVLSPRTKCGLDMRETSSRKARLLRPALQLTA